jgi:acetolactate synthase regulatory subunit
MTGEWISVNERLPEDGQRVLAMTAERGVTVAMMANAREQESGEAMSELKAAKGLVVAMIQTDANGKFEGTPQ